MIYSGFHIAELYIYCRRCKSGYSVDNYVPKDFHCKCGRLFYFEEQYGWCFRLSPSEVASLEVADRFTTRTRNALLRKCIDEGHRIEDLLNLPDYQLRMIRGIGDKTIEEIREKYPSPTE